MLLLTLGQGCSSTTSKPAPQPAVGSHQARVVATDHPRLWIRKSDLPRLRGWAVASNPVFAQGVGALAAAGKSLMDKGTIPNSDGGGAAWVEYPTEAYAQLFAFMSLVSPNAADRADYAQRARTLLMTVINAAAQGAGGGKFRTANFSTYDRSRYYGDAYGLTVDWIYDTLTAADKTKIRAVFLRWCDENMHAATTTQNHPVPIGVTNDPVLLKDPIAVRWSGNNYYTAHMRNLGLMAMSFDAADDADGKLRAYLDAATGAWLYTVDHLLRGDQAGGLGAEGPYYFTDALTPVAHLLLALATSGNDDTAARGKQVAFAGNPFWDELVAGFFHASSPTPVQIPSFSGLGKFYLHTGYGDAARTWMQEYIGVFGALGSYDYLAGNAKRLAASRWIQRNMAPGEAAFLTDRAGNSDALSGSMLYFLLFDPAVGAGADPRPSYPLSFHATGIDHVYARTDWGKDASWFVYFLPWLSVDHQHADGNQFQLWRKGEWITHEITGYSIDTSDFHNTLTLQNSSAQDPSAWMGPFAQKGSQWINGVAKGDPTLLSKSFTQNFVYLSGDALNLYNSDYQKQNDLTEVTRDVVWLKPDHLVVYDRADSKTASRYKRFWLQLPKAITTSGNRSTTTTPKGQVVTVTSLLPTGATITSSKPNPPQLAEGETFGYSLRVEAPGGPQKGRFLHVVQGSDAGKPGDTATLIKSSAGTSFEGAQFGTTAVLFPVDRSAAISGTTFSVDAGTKLVLVTGLKPATGYDVTTAVNGAQRDFTIATGSQQQTDSGGVLVWPAGGSPPDPDGGIPQVGDGGITPPPPPGDGVPPAQDGPGPLTEAGTPIKNKGDLSGGCAVGPLGRGRLAERGEGGVLLLGLALLLAWRRRARSSR